MPQKLNNDGPSLSIRTGKHNIHLASQYCWTNWQAGLGYTAADVARFVAKVGQPTATGCWVWLASRMDTCGHGQFTRRVDGVQQHLYAHRVSWELARGPIPDGLCVLHDCPGGDNASCVNPDHLFLGTQQDNLADARRKGRLNERLPRTGKLTLAQREAIFAAPRERGSGEALAAQYGVSACAISLIRQGRFARPALPQQFPNLILERVPSVQVVIRGEVA